MNTIKKKDLNELVGGDMTSDGGDKPFDGDSEIETGPVQKDYADYSDYEKGVSTTGDVVFGRYTQNIPWFAVYSYGSRRAGVGSLVTFESRLMTKKTVEEKIEDLVKKTKDTIKDAELTEKQLEELKKALKDKEITKNL